MTDAGGVSLQLRGFVDREERVFPLAGDVLSLGRAVDNDVVLPDPSVSRYHAELRREGEGWVARDLGSTNGLSLNGERVKRAALGAGDLLGVGSFELLVEEEPQGGGLSATSTLVRPLADFAADYGLGPHETDKRRLLDQAYSNRIFGYLTRLAGLLLAADSVDEVLSRVIDLAFEALPVDRGFILLLDDGGEAVCELARQGDLVEWRPGGEVPVSSTMLRKVMDDRVALITLDAQSDQRLRGGESIRLHQIRAAMCAPLWSQDRIVGVMQVDSPYRTGTFTEQDLDLFTALANYAAVAVERLRYAKRVEQERRLRARLERYHSPSVIEAVMSRDEAVEGVMGRLQPAQVTVLFADLVNFTPFAENAEPAAVAELLAGFFDTAVEAIFAAGGTLDKFIGDCVMAFFGAPVTQADHAARALAAAVEIQRGLARWNDRHATDALPRLEARIALNSGPVVVGEVGSSRRVDYTVLGNTVNVAARLEEAVATPGSIVLGAETRRLLGREAAAESLGEVQLKGLSQPVEAFRVWPGEGE